MLLDRGKYKESAYIGEELFSDAEKDRLHTLMIAERTIADGDFSLEEALEAYKIEKSEYEIYLANKTNADISFSISGSTGNSQINIVHLEVLSKAFDQYLSQHFRNYSVVHLDKFKKEMGRVMKELEKHTAPSEL